MPIHVKARHLLASTVAVAVFALPVQAQYSGPSAISQTTVAEILKNPVDDQDVQIQGHLLRQTAHDKYIFSDGTGEIVAEIKGRHFAGQSVDDETKVELIGEVDTSRKHPPKIEVDSVRVVE